MGRRCECPLWHKEARPMTILFLQSSANTFHFRRSRLLQLSQMFGSNCGESRFPKEARSKTLPDTGPNAPNGGSAPGRLVHLPYPSDLYTTKLPSTSDARQTSQAFYVVIPPKMLLIESVKLDPDPDPGSWIWLWVRHSSSTLDYALGVNRTNAPSNGCTSMHGLFLGV